MTCHRIVQNGVFVGYACTRGRGAKAHACACGRTATRLCDGRVRTPTNRTRRCDRPLCDTHWRPILPRKEVYSKDFTELGWKSASEVLVPDGRGLTA